MPFCISWVYLETKHVDCVFNKFYFVNVSPAISDFISEGLQFFL